MFMVDIESTGVDIKLDQVLQIAFLKLLRVDGFWQPHDWLEFPVQSHREPRSEFAIKHMAETYKRSNAVPYEHEYRIRDRILDFIGTGRPKVCGWNASNFDLAMLVEKGYLMPPGYATVDGVDTSTGDFDYRVYEMGGLIAGMVDAYGIERKTLIEEAKKIGENLTGLPTGAYEYLEGKSAHDALYDCVEQTKILNGLIFYMRERS